MNIGPTDKQLRFVELLLDPESDCAGVPRRAARAAGYSSTNAVQVMNSPVVLELIRERSENLLKTLGPKAVLTLFGGMMDPTKPGTKDALSAANSVLDRIGLGKRETITHEVDNSAVVILPAKSKEEPQSEQD